MGWKAVRDHYRIEHTVATTADGMIVGSGYVPDIVTIGGDGSLAVRDGARRGDIGRIVDEMETDPMLLVGLMRSDDAFERSIPVYTWEGHEIIQRFCEETGWPNVTHDGHVMYENRYSTDRAEAVKWAMASAAACIEGYERMVAQARADLLKVEDQLAKAIETKRMLRRKA